MSDPSKKDGSTLPAEPAPKLARRGFLGKAGGLMVAAGTLAAGSVAEAAVKPKAALEPAPSAVVAAKDGIEPFFGTHQGGIVTPQQDYTYLAVFDLQTEKRAEVIALLQRWTDAANKMTRGQNAGPLGNSDGVTGSDPDSSANNVNDIAPGDSGEALGLQPSRLTITFGFGPGLFERNGVDRYGLAQRRPAALVDLPKFNGDQLVPEKTGGDICIQACANDAQVAFHAVRQLARLAYGAAGIKWVQTGFQSAPKDGSTGRNLMGFKDGTNNPSTTKPELMNQFVWAGDEGPAWMKNGTYTVVRRIRITLEHWDRMQLSFQEQVVGRHKYSGAPLGKAHEFDPVDLAAQDKDGNSVIPDNSHVRLSNPGSNDGEQILRRGYSYNDGANFYVERWPPWRQEVEYDAGLLFVAHQRDPRTGFIRINEKLSKIDIMNQFITHVGSGIFASPPGAAEGSYIGAALFEGLPA
jgi:deferrochelatase/peroxidase EfeB